MLLEDYWNKKFTKRAELAEITGAVALHGGVKKEYRYGQGYEGIIEKSHKETSFIPFEVYQAKFEKLFFETYFFNPDDDYTEPAFAAVGAEWEGKTVFLARNMYCSDAPRRVRMPTVELNGPQLLLSFIKPVIKINQVSIEWYCDLYCPGEWEFELERIRQEVC